MLVSRKHSFLIEFFPIPPIVRPQPRLRFRHQIEKALAGRVPAALLFNKLHQVLADQRVERGPVRLGVGACPGKHLVIDC